MVCGDEVHQLQIKQGLPPVIGERSHTLILGSLPGDESIRTRRYYADPRNQFWTILSRVYQADIEDGYEERIAFLLSHDLALWDVLRSAQRDGSVDYTIRNGDPNDFGPLLRTYPELTAIGFNGRKAYDLFLKYVMKQERSVWLDRSRVGILPSSSPAPGRYVLPLDEKVVRWREFLLPLPVD